MKEERLSKKGRKKEGGEKLFHSVKAALRSNPAPGPCGGGHRAGPQQGRSRLLCSAGLHLGHVA